MWQPDGKKQHRPLPEPTPAIPLPVANENVADAKDVCHIMGLPEGCLLNSGASYHYIGNGTVATERGRLRHLLFVVIVIANVVFDDALVDAHGVVKTADVPEGLTGIAAPSPPLALQKRPEGSRRG